MIARARGCHDAGVKSKYCYPLLEAMLGRLRHGHFDHNRAAWFP